LFAVINANGTIARTGGANAATTAKLPAEGAGAYKVGFNRNVRGCAYVATIGGNVNVGTTAQGQIETEGRFDNPNGVFVQTANSAGVQTASPFTLFVDCTD